MAVWDRCESRAWVLGVCLGSGALCPALTLAACGGRTAILNGDANDVSTGGAVPSARTSSSGGKSGSGTPSTGVSGGGAAPSTGGAGGGSAGGSDPCAGVTCNTPPVAICKTATVATTYAANGTCSAGTCSYVPTNSGCGTNEACAGAGVCSECKTDPNCGPTCTACGGGTPKCKDLGTTSRCVGCLSSADCSGATPSCNTTTNVCGPPPSCVGLAATCGPSGNASCCASNLVTGGTFNRSNDANYPATVSDFRLDTYQVTVGRFRKFVAAYSETMIVAGAGANPNNASDTGWSTVWNGSLDASQGALATALKCDATHQTWTDAPGSAAAESLPINCINWFDAEAFCIWDGGRLPTEAEWNYAAAGGTQQRVYRWE